MLQLHILIVEHDPSDVYAFTRLLQDANPQATLDIATDGPAALSKLAETSFGLIVINQAMPSMAGMALLSSIRALPHHADTPIAVLAAQGSAENVLAALDAGASQYFEKPLDSDSILKMLSSNRAFTYTVSRRA